MAKIPGLKADVFFGDTEKPLPDWRLAAQDSETDEDDDSPEHTAAVIAILGFDPNEGDGEAKQ